MFEGKPDFALPLRFYQALVWLSLISAIAFSIWFYLLKLPQLKVSELNVWKFVIPMSGAILSWIILPNESPNIIIIAGMLCVVASIILFNWLPQRKNSIL